MSVSGPESQPDSSNLYNEILSESDRRHRLLSVHWELTYRCNEKCTHCYLDVFTPNANVPGELSTEECLGIIDQMTELGVLNLTFSGGEILVRRDFFRIAEYARSKRFLLRLFTNGILIKPEIADRIAALHPYAVEVSLYSAKPEVHDAITRRKRSWELTTRALRLLNERGVRTMVKTPLMRENVCELNEVRAIAKELGAQFRYDVTITPKDTGGLEPLKHRISYDDMVEVFRKEVDSSVWLERKITDETHTCGIARSAMAIDPYGNVIPCLQTRFIAGNLRDRSLREIWQSSPVWQELGHLTIGELPICRTCELKTLCLRCHGLALLETGDLRGPALANCRAALARCQVFVEKGFLPADYPIPAHLQTCVASLASDQADLPKVFGEFISMSQLNHVQHSAAANALGEFAGPSNRR